MKAGSLEQFWTRLFRWFATEGRCYSWRETDDPFRILTAEILLQKTDAARVEPVYLHLVQRYPHPQCLAEANITELETILRPLGLRYRAGRLKKCAEIVLCEFRGRVPPSRSELKRLPGVGDYIADAVLCYAFGFPAVPIDANVLRVFGRYFGLTSAKNRARNDSKLLEKIRQMYAFANAETFRTANLAVLDFGGLICTARNPKCSICPAVTGCAAN